MLTRGQPIAARVAVAPVDPITHRWVKAPIRAPNFKVPGGAAAWAYRTWPPEEHKRTGFKVLLCLCGYIDAGIDTVSIRELSEVCKLEPKRVLQHLAKLERTNWIIVDWAQHHNERNWYAANYNRQRVPSFDPNRRTYQPKRSEK